MKDPHERPASVPDASAGPAAADTSAPPARAASGTPSTEPLNARRSGRGPRLVMLHGLFGDLGNFHSVALHLARQLEVCRVDLPGHGQSPGLRSLDIDALADRVARWITEQEIEGCHLLGHSLGGKVAMALAGRADAPAIASLTVVDIAPRHYPPQHQPIIDALLALDMDTLADRRDADRTLRDAVPDAGVRAFLLKSLTRGDDGRFGWAFDLQGIADSYPAMCEAPSIERTIEVPALFIKGGRSDYLGSDDEVPIRAACRSPVFREIGGAGHWPHAEKPALFTRVCLDFVLDAEAARPGPAASATTVS